MAGVMARRVRLGWLAWTLLGVSVVLSVLSMAVPAFVDHPLTTERGEIRLYLDVIEEGNLPTWWSTGLLVLGALVHCCTAAAAWGPARREAWAWLGSAALLVLLSLDEHTQLHERLDRVGRELVTYESFPFYWLLPGLVIGAAVVLALALLAGRLRGPARWCCIAGCLLLLGAALGGELLQGVLLGSGETGVGYVLTYHAEELGENIGALLMVAAAVQALRLTRSDHGVEISYAS
ncbi:MAG TPA: hypothetical protein VGD67_02135 [Pseudonocardiaceae bacterium]